MSKFFAIIIIFLLVLTFWQFFKNKPQSKPNLSAENKTTTVAKENNVSENTTEPISSTAQGLDTPWAITFLPEGDMLFTERPGRVRYIDRQGKLETEPVANLKDVKEIGEGGLLGITLHPDFLNNRYVYLYYTYSKDGENILNRVVRMTYQNRKLTDEKVLVDKIPGAANHNGGRIKFGPDNFLYITTGDAQVPSRAQDTNSLAGKILRVTDDGQKAQGNPFDNLIYSYGHRNPQGIAWNKENQLWATEHGRSGIPSGLDEINFIESGKNYGWPTIQGEEKKSGMVTPVNNSGSQTWAPAGAVFIDNYFFFAGLRGQRLYRATIINNRVQKIDEYLVNQYGRLREVILGPDGKLYVSTSNQDGRGLPRKEDDQILKIDPEKL